MALKNWFIKVCILELICCVIAWLRVAACWWLIWEKMKTLFKRNQSRIVFTCFIEGGPLFLQCKKSICLRFEFLNILRVYKWMEQLLWRALLFKIADSLLLCDFTLPCIRRYELLKRSNWLQFVHSQLLRQSTAVLDVLFISLSYKLIFGLLLTLSRLAIVLAVIWA